MKFDFVILASICTIITFCSKLLYKCWSSRNKAIDYFLEIWKNPIQLVKWITNSIFILIVPIHTLIILSSVERLGIIKPFIALTFLFLASIFLYYTTGRLIHAFQAKKEKNTVF